MKKGGNIGMKGIRRLSFSRAVGNTLVLLCAGIFSGVTAKLLDICSVYLGDIFSRIPAWIFLCALIAAKSASAKRAAVNVFGFCAGMLAAYYLTAMLTKSVYSAVFACGWGIFALFSPLMGALVWCAGKKAPRSAAVSAGVVTLMAAVLLSGKIRGSDIVFAVLTGAVLY